MWAKARIGLISRSALPLQSAIAFGHLFGIGRLEDEVVPTPMQMIARLADPPEHTDNESLHSRSWIEQCPVRGADGIGPTSLSSFRRPCCGRCRPLTAHTAHFSREKIQPATRRATVADPSISGWHSISNRTHLQRISQFIKPDRRRLSRIDGEALGRHLLRPESASAGRLLTPARFVLRVRG